MNVLVIGCGYIGERVADLLHEAHHAVCAVTHSEESARALTQSKPYAVHAADVGEKIALHELASRCRKPEIIFHSASSSRGGVEMYRRVFLEGCGNLSEVFPQARIIFTSSTSVYPQTDGSWVTEQSDATPERETSRILRETEDFVIAHDGVAARLAGIYGPARSFVLKQFLEGRAAIEGDENGRWLNQIHCEDAARALVHLALHDARGLCNISDDTPLTQRACFEKMAVMFDKPMPPVVPPNTSRKRAFTSKRVSNAKLRATGWTPAFPSYFAALQNDASLVPSIVSQLSLPTKRDSPRATNIVLIGLMGSGKSAVGKLAAQGLGFDFVDTDQLVVEKAGRSIPEIFLTEGEAGFRKRETAALASLSDSQRRVIATGGGIVTQPENLPLLRKLGLVVWLTASPEMLHRRTAHSHDRPLLREGDPLMTLRSLLEARAPLYESVCDLRIATDELSVKDAAYGLAESARVHFSAPY